MISIFPTRIHLAVVRGKELALFWRSEMKVQKWDIFSGICSTKPDGRYAEMIIAQFLPDTVMTISDIKELDISLKPGLESYFVDGGIYRCDLSHIALKHRLEHIRFMNGSDIPRRYLTDQAYAALVLCL